MSHSVPVLDTLGAILLLLWAVVMWAAVGVLFFANRRSTRPGIFYGAAGVIMVGIVGQIGHFQEHVAQAGYWVGHPNAQPWMTPWGTGLAKGFGRVDMTKPSLGMEILHLTGNFIFLAGIAGVMVITRRATQTRSRKWGKMGMWMQTIHGMEHLALTLSVWFGAKQAIGLSTWFGQLPPGPGLWTYRVWWHAIANLIGTMIFGIALFHLWRERAAIRAAHGLPATSPAERTARRPRTRPLAEGATPAVALDD